jgi:demethylmenaquinone methyltransferase/2-methoxy-6-polyprenyl-1,4-benzoquinol methylase
MSDSAVAGNAAEKGTLPEGQVEAMFDRIASRYDLMNSVMTAGLHDEWRRRAVEISGVGPGDHVLDVATGTGDLAFELARAVSPGGSVTGADFSEQMLAVAREKQPVALAGLDAEVIFEQGNALELKYDDDTFDAVTVGFGVRNFSDLAAGLTEMARVVRPGGKFVILEISQPQKGVLAAFYKAWFDGVVPQIGRFAGEDSAYTYLPNSVKRFARPEELARVLHDAGTEQVGWLSLAGGIITIHHGIVR